MRRHTFFCCGVLDESSGAEYAFALCNKHTCNLLLLPKGISVLFLQLSPIWNETSFYRILQHCICQKRFVDLVGDLHDRMTCKMIFTRATTDTFRFVTKISKDVSLY